MVQKLFSGIYKVAENTGAIIVPVATHLEGDTCYAIVDKAFDITHYSQSEGISILRNKLAGLKWELIETYSKRNRAELLNGQDTKSYWKNCVENRIAELSFYDREVENNAHFKDKNEMEEEEVFAFLKKMEIKRENAFLAHAKFKMQKRKEDENCII